MSAPWDLPWPVTSTIDGQPVLPNLWVWDYDLNLCQVTAVDHVDQAGQVWFRTTTGMFDNKRMWVRHPSTGQVATSKPRTCQACGEAEAEGVLKHPTFGVDMHYCPPCLMARRPHLYRSATAIMAFCGAVIRHKDRPGKQMVQSNDLSTVHPDTCPECITHIKEYES